MQAVKLPSYECGFHAAVRFDDRADPVRFELSSTSPTSGSHAMQSTRSWVADDVELEADSPPSQWRVRSSAAKTPVSHRVHARGYWQPESLLTSYRQPVPRFAVGIAARKSIYTHAPSYNAQFCSHAGSRPANPTAYLDRERTASPPNLNFR